MRQPCHTNLSFDDAQALLRAEVLPLATEDLPLAQAGRRVLAAPLHAGIDSPRENVAAMDGFAVEARALAAGRQRFRLAGTNYAGHPAVTTTDPESAVRVMTGAAMPAGKDRVIPIELVEIGADWIRLDAPIPAAPHVRLRGSGFAQAQELLPRGALLDPGKLLLAAAADQPTLPVHRQPRISIIASGDELVPPGQAAATRTRIPDSLSLPLALFAHDWHAEITQTVLVGDDSAQLRDAVAGADADVILMLGGASIGDRDLARAALAPLGLDLRFSGVTMKPGKPVWYGRLGAAHVLGLPGNPAAAMVTARLFLAPLLCRLAGRDFNDALDWTRLPLAAPASAGDARDMFLFGRRHDGRVEIIPRQSASAQLPLATANVLVRRPAHGAALPEGALVPVLPLW